MPVMASYCTANGVPNDTSIHKCFAAGVHLRVLCDWIATPIGIISLGDIGITAGEALWLYGLVVWAVLMIVHYHRTRQ